MRDLSPLYIAVVMAVGSAQAHAMSMDQAIQNTMDNPPQIHAHVDNRSSVDEGVKFIERRYQTNGH